MKIDLSNFPALDDEIQERFEEEYSPFLKKLGIGTGRRKEAKALGLTGKDKRDYVKKLRKEDKGLTAAQRRELAKQRRQHWRDVKSGGGVAEEDYEDEEDIKDEEDTQDEMQDETKGGKKKSSKRVARMEDDYEGEERKILGMERKTGMIVVGVGSALVLGLGILLIVKLTNK